MKYSIGETVQINIDKVDQQHKKYTRTYKIVDIKKTFEGVYIYKLKGVPHWGTEELLLPITIKNQCQKS